MLTQRPPVSPRAPLRRARGIWGRCGPAVTGRGRWQVLETVVCCLGGEVSGTRLRVEKYFGTFMLQEKMCNARREMENPSVGLVLQMPLSLEIQILPFL